VRVPPNPCYSMGLTQSTSSLMYAPSRQVLVSMGLRNMIEEHNMLLERGFGKAGKKMSLHSWDEKRSMVPHPLRL